MTDPCLGGRGKKGGAPWKRTPEIPGAGDKQIADLDQAIRDKIGEAGLQEAWQLLQSVPAMQERGAAASSLKREPT